MVQMIDLPIQRWPVQQTMDQEKVKGFPDRDQEDQQNYPFKFNIYPSGSSDGMIRRLFLPWHLIETRWRFPLVAKIFRFSS